MVESDYGFGMGRSPIDVIWKKQDYGVVVMSGNKKRIE